jgi:hypothetical protein
LVLVPEAVPRAVIAVLTLPLTQVTPEIVQARPVLSFITETPTSI